MRKKFAYIQLAKLDVEDELITVDHVYPKSLGGSEMDVENLQPMIGEYNWAKGSTV